MAYEIIALDLDGTLTNSQKLVTEPTKKALERIQREGKKIVLASGRPTPGILPLAKELNLTKYGGFILAFNGARIINCATKEIIYDCAMPKEQIPLLYQEAVKEKIGILSYSDEEILLGNGVDEYNKLEARINNIPMRTVDNFPEYINFPVNKCLMTGEGRHLAKIEKSFQEKFQDSLSIYRSEPFFLEAMPKGIDKANSLSVLLEKLALTREQLICCGDGFNDLSMIKYAGLGVAMENAQEIVKEAADYITTSNDEDGVARVIEQFM